ncbi:hypothetical protein C8Q75DRAFT_893232 [Abortiporus biennis]|nr:hypothetical protein C8Q75DRAFT_893232 [Abortiporus biennis]
MDEPVTKEEHGKRRVRFGDDVEEVLGLEKVDERKLCKLPGKKIAKIILTDYFPPPPPFMMTQYYNPNRPARDRPVVLRDTEDFFRFSSFAGKFDLFPIRTRSLQKPYRLLPGGKMPNFAGFYKTLVSFRDKNGSRNKLALRPAPSYQHYNRFPTLEAGKCGTFQCSEFCDPFTQESFPPLHILMGDVAMKLHLKKDESVCRDTAGYGPGFYGLIYIGNQFPGDPHYNIIDNAVGFFKMRSIWRCRTDPSKELFEGFWSLSIQYASSLNREAREITGRFWAVRGRKDKGGREIGISAGRNYMYVDKPNHPGNRLVVVKELVIETIEEDAEEEVFLPSENSSGGDENDDSDWEMEVDDEVEYEDV